jgi:hypothetical protein
VCAIITFKLGANRSSSEPQLASREAGATVSSYTWYRIHRSANPLHRNNCKS